jgi:hypothetical protein
MGARVWYEINIDAMKFAMWDDRGNQERGVFIGGNEWRLVKQHELMPPEAIHELHDAQGLLDALLAAGVRPSSNAWSAGHVADLKAHIAFAERVAIANLPTANGGASK